MPKIPFNYHCAVCGYKNRIESEVPLAPGMTQFDFKCESCGDKTHLLMTICPECGVDLRYFQSDLDFIGEVQKLSETYVTLIRGIRDSLSDYIKEFDVPLPKTWSVKLDCGCGHSYTAEIDLPQM